MTSVTYSIGDIHGKSAHLRGLLGLIYADFARGGYAFGELVFTGDYVDRGEDSKGVLDILIAGSEVPALNFVTLLGNHDDSLFTAGKYWVDRYATSTLKSFGVDDVKDIDREYKDFMSRLWLKYESGPFFFCHAGVDPNRDLDDQIRDDLLWIRHEFLGSDRDYGKIVVHGHTPVYGKIDIRPNRINVDSHCYKSGVLSAMKFDGDISTIQFFSTEGVPQLDAFAAFG